MKTKSKSQVSSDTTMLAITISDTLAKEGYDSVTVNMVFKAVHSHEAILREAKSMFHYIQSYGGEVTSSFNAGGNNLAVEKVLKQAEGK
jgi:hypothetical protein